MQSFKEFVEQLQELNNSVPTNKIKKLKTGDVIVDINGRKGKVKNHDKKIQAMTVEFDDGKVGSLEYDEIKSIK